MSDVTFEPLAPLTTWPPPRLECSIAVCTQPHGPMWVCLWRPTGSRGGWTRDIFMDRAELERHLLRCLHSPVEAVVYRAS